MRAEALNLSRVESWENTKLKQMYFNISQNIADLRNDLDREFFRKYPTWKEREKHILDHDKDVDGELEYFFNKLSDLFAKGQRSAITGDSNNKSSGIE